LHRIEANVQPGNIASKKLLEKSGFTKEGFSKEYLNIAGKGWKDHERWAILNANWESNYELVNVNVNSWSIFYCVNPGI